MRIDGGCLERVGFKVFFQLKRVHNRLLAVTDGGESKTVESDENNRRNHNEANLIVRF
jgi:hypothetical protein